MTAPRATTVPGARSASGPTTSSGPATALHLGAAGRSPVGEMPHLHVPDEPSGRKGPWFDAALDGTGLEDVVAGPDGVARWLWSRWRSLAVAGVTEDDLVAIVAGYRREVWLWLAGERTWAQCCSGLLGRIGRRLPG